MCHIYIYPIVPSLNWVEQTPSRLFLHNQYTVLQWKGNVWGKGLERNGWRHVRSGRRLMWSSCSFCSPRNTDIRSELDQTLSCLSSGWGLMRNRKPSEALPVHGSAPLSSGRHGRHRLDQWYLKLFFFFFDPAPSPLPATHLWSSWTHQP